MVFVVDCMNEHREAVSQGDSFKRQETQPEENH